MARQFSTMRAVAVVAIMSAGLAGCATSGGVTRVRLSERECLARVMYFESNRSSDAGMIAVGTVVMNRLKSGKYGTTICQVVGAPQQFAPGVLTRPMNDRGAPRAYRNADLVLSGKRHYGVQNAMFFHTYGYRFPYRNMHYLVTAGGNTFYEKKQPPKGWFGNEGSWPAPPRPTEDVGDGGVMVASAKPRIEIIPDEPRREPAPRVEERIVVAQRDALPEAPTPLYDRRSGDRPRLGGRPDAKGMYDDAEARAAMREEMQQANRAPTRVAAAAPITRTGPTVEEAYEQAEVAPPPVRRPRPAPRSESYQVARNDVAPTGQRYGNNPGNSYGNGGNGWSDDRIDSAPLAAPAGVRAAPAPRAARVDDYDPAPQPQPVRAPRTQVAAREISPAASRQPVEASAASLGWRAGPPPAVDYEAHPRAEDSRPVGRQAWSEGAQPASRGSSRGGRGEAGIDDLIEQNGLRPGDSISR